MIKKTEVFQIGHFYKTHGVSGELSLSFTTDIFDRTESPYWVLDMDGIFVPFFVESYRFRSDSSALVILEGIDNEKKAKELVGKTVFYPVEYADNEDNVSTEDDVSAIIGYNVSDKNHGSLGQIISIDDSTINVLLVVEGDNGEVLIPVAGDFLLEIDSKSRTLHVELPEGYLEL
jgi:16S rRNA processing protein RimM